MGLGQLGAEPSAELRAAVVLVSGDEVGWGHCIDKGSGERWLDPQHWGVSKGQQWGGVGREETLKCVGNAKLELTGSLDVPTSI